MTENDESTVEDDGEDRATAEADGGEQPTAAAQGEEQQTAAVDAESREVNRFAEAIDRFINRVELVAAAVFALLFAVGVADLILQIGQAVLSGSITDPLVVIGFIDTGLLLLIIVEVYQTVVAYTTRSETSDIVRLVVYTGVIAMVRKVIIFRTGEYATTQDALLAAVSYSIIIVGLVSLLVVDSYRQDGFRSR